jgi:uncharacterized membrane protein YfcA
VHSKRIRLRPDRSRLCEDAFLNRKAAILALLLVVGAWFCAAWAHALFFGPGVPSPPAFRPASTRPARPSVREILVGALTDFLDTLGIGSFATTTSLYRILRRMEVPDRVIPGTLNVGHALPTVVQALVYIAIVRVEPETLAAMIAGAVTGAWLGSGMVARWPTRPIRIGLGGSLVCAAMLMTAQQVHAVPAGGDALALHGARLAAGVCGNAALGALMTIGVGLYGPCMVLVSVLGMNPTAAFPIMMGSCAFLMPVAGARFIARGSYLPSAALGLAIGGVPAVGLAAWLVRSLPLRSARWLVVVVVSYTAVQMLRSALRPGPQGERDPAGGPSNSPAGRDGA